MRTSLWLLALGLISMCVLAAAEKPSDDYVKAMKDLGAAMATMNKPGAFEDYEAATKAAATAKASFAVAEKYWKDKNVADAISAAQTGGKAAADLDVSANLKSSEGVEAAVKDIAATCGGCHTAHRERLPDGSFQIK